MVGGQGGGSSPGGPAIEPHVVVVVGERIGLEVGWNSGGTIFPWIPGNRMAVHSILVDGRFGYSLIVDGGTIGVSDDVVTIGDSNGEEEDIVESGVD